MGIISFAWTTPAFLAGAKSVTRRDWDDDYARRFKVGQVITGYNKSPRFGGERIGIIRLTQDPVKESTALAPQEDYAREGFSYLQRFGISLRGRMPGALWADWMKNPQNLYVVRFEIITINKGFCVVCERNIRDYPRVIEIDTMPYCENCYDTHRDKIVQDEQMSMFIDHENTEGLKVWRR